jgi:hypothetical protein
MTWLKREQGISETQIRLIAASLKLFSAYV